MVPYIGMANLMRVTVGGISSTNSCLRDMSFNLSLVQRFPTVDDFLIIFNETKRIQQIHSKIRTASKGKTRRQP
jgi:hypothetical protein